MNQTVTPPKRPLRRVAAISIGVSFCGHAGLLAALFAAKVMDYQNGRPVVVSVAAVAAPVRDEQPATVKLSAVEPEAAGVDSELVRSRIDEMVATSQQQSPAENLRELTKMSQRLVSVASDQSLENLADQFHQWMGLSQRIAEPRTAEESHVFDVESAQFHDVRRTETPSGPHDYFAILIDAEGRTLEIEMTEGEGRDLFELMQRLKGNPLLEKIYRSIAMPLLDNLLQTLRARPGSTSSIPLEGSLDEFTKSPVD